MSINQTSRKYRSIWISDTHLGSRGCKAEFLLDFLQRNNAEHLYLVGDIVDGWALRKRWYWDEFHDQILHLLFERAQHGTQVTYVSGNHDEFLRPFIHHQITAINLEDEVVHTTADGRKFLILHGDQFDGVMQFARWLAKLGDWVYERLLVVNTLYNKLRRWMGYPYWSLSAYLKHKTKSAVNFISAFEETLAKEARRRELDGIICGHIHHAEIREIDGILYCNDGDWVESCTALVEEWDGSLRILEWTEISSESVRSANAPGIEPVPVGS
ncbi:MAG: UDP-2,3-diacylglucosamine diphosphatase [Gammaproteobacteria bacterium]|nr:UDP-2,3-diacylglucosamine diphosphatase [Gammaproteobacteria bacterium]